MAEPLSDEAVAAFQAAKQKAEQALEKRIGTGSNLPPGEAKAARAEYEAAVAAARATLEAPAAPAEAPVEAEVPADGGNV